VTELGDVAQISSGMDHVCALTTAGGVKCWGDNVRNQVGNGTLGTDVPTPVAVYDSGVARISAGGFHTCALTTGGGAQCWGDNSSGQLGNGTISSQTSPGIATPGNVHGLASDVVQISGGTGHTCAVTTGGDVKCWGSNGFGVLGLGNGTLPPPQGEGPYRIATPGDVSGLTNGVAALWDAAPIAPVVPWTFSGFYHPVEMGSVWNRVKSGSTVPIKFQVFQVATELTDPLIVVRPLTATQTLCSGGPTDTIELTATGKTRLRYDTDGGHFIYNWKTPRMPGYCYTITVALTNGASLSANFELR
jgi:hypothetical protein